MGAASSLGLLPPTDTLIRTRALAAGVDLERLPRHIAIVMDGNGRWAQQRGLPRLIGHREGYKNLRRVLLDAADLGIPVMTVYAFSTENWKRPADEVNGLFHLIERAARDELRTLHQSNVRVLVSGRLHEVPASLRDALLAGVDLTRDNNRIVFNLAINYGGRAEVVDAVRAIAQDAAERRIAPSDITEDLISAHLYHPELPDPDLVIRTAGEQRISNFLLWQSAYAEYHVCPEPWPAFDEKCLFRAVKDYEERVRKFGSVVGA
ncbi:MAG: di-trans,poly-cis-decaprenylcistransferase [Fimbriimonadia bacterium]|jgi:undecaprenyl diphosphate synthase